MTDTHFVLNILTVPTYILGELKHLTAKRSLTQAGRIQTLITKAVLNSGNQIPTTNAGTLYTDQ